ncbi:hypothetical protein [Fervidobacterium sp.]
MRRLVVRFRDGTRTSLDLVEGQEREELARRLRHFVGREVAEVLEQAYDPRLPTRFRYARREDLEAYAKDVCAGKGVGVSDEAKKAR